MIERFARIVSSRFNPWSPSTGATKLRLHTYSIGTPNLEVFKFGIYIMFPIGWMYYFGTNLENRFSVPDFWPDPESTHKIPYEKREQLELMNTLKSARLERRRKRLELEEKVGGAGGGELRVSDTEGTEGESPDFNSEAPIRGKELVAGEGEKGAVRSRNTFRLGVIDRWASGK